jgi:hypothetical protein
VAGVPSPPSSDHPIKQWPQVPTTDKVTKLEARMNRETALAFQITA